jgi:ketosteroid isomerase-like protein
MRYAIALVAVSLCLCIRPAVCQSASADGQRATNAPQSDVDAIQRIEADLIKAEGTTDVAVFERTLADDYVNLGPHGFGPNKNKIIEGMKPHAGQAPPYSVEMHDLHVYVLGDAAVAASVRTYTAKENGNIANEDSTHIFVRDHGNWKLKISRASNCPMN